LHAGRRLKVLRSARRLTGRQVEEASRRIAAAKRDKRFCISNAWLTQLEKGVSEPSICKIFSLSTIYRVKFLDLIRLYEVDVDEIEKLGPIADPHSTNLLSAKIDEIGAVSEPQSLQSSLCERSTALLSGTIGHASETLPGHASSHRSPQIAYGYIGLNDATMYPMIRPGSVVRIDTSQTKPQSVTQHNQFQRPIYFVELRDGYACGWCELQGNDLLIIPHHSSPAHIRRFIYLKEAEIVGRVISFNTQCVDQDARESDLRSDQKLVHNNSTA